MVIFLILSFLLLLLSVIPLLKLFDSCLVTLKCSPYRKDRINIFPLFAYFLNYELVF